jgi:hypothetical protein
MISKITVQAQAGGRIFKSAGTLHCVSWSLTNILNDHRAFMFRVKQLQQRSHYGTYRHVL